MDQVEDRGGHMLKGPDMVLTKAVETSTSTERVEVLASDSTGREWDAETGMYYYRARYYAPDLKRFITEDPLRFASGDVNWYRYVGNNPVNRTDPLGLESYVDGGSFAGLDPDLIECAECDWLLVGQCIVQAVDDGNNEACKTICASINSMPDPWSRAIAIALCTACTAGKINEVYGCLADNCVFKECEDDLCQ
ncbi:MAG TPA: RHS repeat-associated core domain-containing protein [Nitrospirae bacterium]|nr:RHS repeat-associated core domain-containing protein [Nitrospirota bacterium]